MLLLKSRIQYILTWICLGVLLVAGFGLMALSWNRAVSGSVMPGLFLILWICMSAAGIYLFMLAVKKAHRLWVDEDRKRKAADSEKELPLPSRSVTREGPSLDFTAMARKLVRRLPEELPLEELGVELLKSLARELEIMSGIFYVRKRSAFIAVSTYALATAEGPPSFREGEGLSGQAARDQHVVILTRFPENYLKVFSGLGRSEPAYLAIVPLVHRNRTIALLECTGFRFDPHDIETMFRIFSRDLIEKLSPNLK